MNSNNQKIAFIDFDGTLIEGQSQQLLIKYLFKKGYISQGKYFLIIFWFLLYKLHFVTQTKKITKYALTIIAGKSEKEFETIFDDFFKSECVRHFRKHSQDLVTFLKEKGYYTLLLSAAIDPIAVRAQRFFGIDECISTQLEIESGFYTGDILGESVHGSEKVRIVKEQALLNGIDLSKALCVSDHKTDIDLFKSVGFPIAVNPSHSLKTYAQKHIWPVVYLEDDESFQYFKSHTKFQ